MLEHACLWLSAPTASGPLAPGRGGKVRAILDAASRELLGHLTLHSRRWPWGRGRRFAAYEAPDASLLFTGSAVGWLRRTTAVEEADGHLVAVVRGDYLLSPAGGFLAVHQQAAHGRSGRFVGPSGADLAQWEANGVGTLIRFGPAVFDEPFVKMGLIAALIG